ncbi:MAG TPA: hypothetical protein VKG38_01375 [Solirubrobacteraceae bacterium]|nr:hypothetical protein [Solirubrobacteraceae bacterium]
MDVQEEPDMKKPSRRPHLHKSDAGGSPAVGAASGALPIEGTDRRTFLEGTAGAAAGAALILATPKMAAVAIDAANPSAGAPPPVVTKPSGPAPYEPVTAYVRNADHNEVTVMYGKRETTYRDPVLVKRLLDAAR